MHNNGRAAISYKDPHGYVFEQDGKFYRFVDYSYQNQYDHLLKSGLYRELIQQQLITSFEELENTSNSKAYKILFPEQIGFITYPYEWSFRQWKECAIVFFKINLILLKYGMILKDATPFNFCLHKGRIVMFDILSFEFYNDGEAWLAYRQFCENFLAPISLMKYNHLRWGKLFQSAINGFDLVFASKNLAFKSYFNFSCLIHIHWHSSMKNKVLKTDGKKKSFLNNAQLTQLWESLSNTIRSWEISKDNSVWLDYYQDDIQSDVYMDLKVTCVNNWLSKIKPYTVTDIGANTGRFSAISAKYANRVIAIESDPYSLNLLYDECRDIPNVYPLYADLSDPSPALGWENGEKRALLNRLENSHTTLALALIHHLRISCNIPLQLIVKLFYQITQKYLLVEFVSKSDTKVQTMLAHRNDIFDDYTTSNFIEICETLFTLVEEKELLGKNRVLYLWERK